MVDRPAGRRGLPALGVPVHRVAPGAPVTLDPVVRFWTATGGDVGMIRVDRLPITSTSLWTRPVRPDPDHVPLQLHFDVKEALGFEHAVIATHRTVLHRPSRVGDRVGHHQALRAIGPERMTALGRGRSWEVDLVLTDARGDLLQVETFSAFGYRPGTGSRASRPRGAGQGRQGDSPGVSGHRIRAAAAASRVWAPVHHDVVAARRAGFDGVIACTQHLAAIAEQTRLREARPHGSVRVLEVRMGRPVVARREGS